MVPCVSPGGLRRFRRSALGKSKAQSAWLHAQSRAPATIKATIMINNIASMQRSVRRREFECAYEVRREQRFHTIELAIAPDRPSLNTQQ
jgi:hypothetical protein